MIEMIPATATDYEILLGTDKALRLMLKSATPDTQTQFNVAMDPEACRSIARRLLAAADAVDCIIHGKPNRAHYEVDTSLGTPSGWVKTHQFVCVFHGRRVSHYGYRLRAVNVSRFGMS